MTKPPQCEAHLLEQDLGHSGTEALCFAEPEHLFHGRALCDACHDVYRWTFLMLSKPVESMPQIMKDALKDLTYDRLREAVQAWEDANEKERLGIANYFERDGAKAVRDLQKKTDDGTPTTADLEGWLRG